MKNLITMLCALVALQLSAQIQPTATLDLGANAKTINVHSSTGIPIIETTSEYIAIHPIKQEVLWKSARSEQSAVGEVAGEDSDDYREFASTIIAFVGKNIINVVTGDLLVDGTAEEIRNISDYHILPEQQMLIVKTTNKSGYKLYGIHAIQNKYLWSAQLDEASGIGQMLSSSENGVGMMKREVKPFISANGNLIYKHRKELIALDPSSGEIKWKGEYDAGALLYSDDYKYLAIAENRSGLGGALGAATSMSLELKLSKKFDVIDVSTGESTYGKQVKLDGQMRFMRNYDNAILVVHDEGFNIFNYTSKDPRWKKDFSEKGIYNVEPQEDGLMVYMKNKRILVNPADGKAVWKKAEKLEKEPPQYSSADQESSPSNDFYIRRSATHITVRKRDGSKSARMNSDFYLYDQDANAIIAIGDASRESTNLGQQGFTLRHLDLNSWKVTKGRTTQPVGLYSIDKADGGYYVAGPRGYQIIMLQDDKIEVVKKEHYPLPGSFGKGMARLGIGLVSTAGAVASTNNYVTNNNASINSYNSQMDGINAVGGSGLNYFTPDEISSDDERYAYFFGRDDDKKLSLFQIEKATGEEKARYEFNDVSPVYEVDYRYNQLYYTNKAELKIYELDN